MSASEKFTPKPNLPPPSDQVGPIAWARANLFSSWFNAIATILIAYALYKLVPVAVNWAWFNATFAGLDRSVCDANSAGGACWTFIKVRFLQIIFGLFYASNPDQIWRPLLTFAILVALVGPMFIPKLKYKFALAFMVLFVFPFVAFGLIHGAWFGLPVADTSGWGGFMLTLILALVGIICAFPLGVVLALGRRSSMPVVKTICVIFIEFWRGAPLITILFMASVMLPLFFPTEVDFDKVFRALIGISLFQSAYTAEAIRGGLQAIPKGQSEAADSLGLSYPKTMGFIVLPQALKIAIPGIVNTFIELFKDTSLVAIIGLLDLLNMAQVASRSIEWKGYDFEGYVFVAVIFWVVCYSMSQFSQYLERKTETGHRRAH